MSKQNNEKLDYALLYATEWKWKVFPCAVMGKTPLTAHGFQDASLDSDQINKWWTDNQNANIGIATGKVSNLVVVDFDTDKGADVNKFLKDFNLDATIFSQTPKAKTGGGLHLYFAYPANATIKNSASKLGKFIDVRADGGYVVAPGSVHANGSEYEWLNDAQSLLEFPQVLIDALNLPNSTSQNQTANNPFIVPDLKPNLIVPDEIGQGQRNQEMAKIAGMLRSKGFGEKAICEALWAENAVICKPPLERSEIELIARSIARYAPKEVLKKTSETDPATPKITTTSCFTLRQLFAETFPPRDILGMHLAKREWGIVAAAKNVGKTTFMRNICFCLAAGKTLPPFIDSNIPRKVLYLDFETTKEMLLPDLKKMFEGNVLTKSEMDLVLENFHVIPKGLINGELFTMQKSMNVVTKLCEDKEIDIVVVDNLSAAFKVQDESSSGPMNDKVVQPILEFIEKANIALIMIHHAGRSNSNNSYAGRGSSVLEDLAPVGFKLEGNLHLGEAITVTNVKRKDGQGYHEVFKLNLENRWFENQPFFVPVAKTKPAKVLLIEYVQSFENPKCINTTKLTQHFSGDVEGFPYISKDVIWTELSKAAARGEISKIGRGFYCNFFDPDEE